MQDITLDVQDKLTLLLALAQHAPPDKERFLDLAERLNFSPLYPYFFNRTAIAALRKMPSGDAQQDTAGSVTNSSP